MEMLGLVGNACVLLISAGAAVSDLKAWKVPNVYLAVWAGAGIAFELVFFGGANLADKCVGAAIPLFVLGLFFCLRLMGAGDIKLFSTLGIWLGSGGVLMCMLFAFAFGAAVSIIRIIRERSGRGRVHVAVFAFVAVLVRLTGVY